MTPNLNINLKTKEMPQAHSDNFLESQNPFLFNAVLFFVLPLKHTTL